MLNDDIFGQIQFEIMWQKKDNYFLYGKEFEITLFIQGEKDEAPTNIQKEAYISFINKKMILMSEIEEKVFEYYQTVLSFVIFASCFFHINRSRFSFLMKKVIIKSHPTKHDQETDD